MDRNDAEDDGAEAAGRFAYQEQDDNDGDESAVRVAREQHHPGTEAFLGEFVTARSVVLLLCSDRFSRSFVRSRQ